MTRSTHRIMAVVLVLTFGFESFAFAIDSKGASYFGGTVSAFKGAKDPVEGTLNTTDDDALLFLANDKPYKGETFSIPYAKIIDLEYGQKAGRRVGTAVATSILLGPIGLLSLFSKKRKHFLTIGFTDANGKDQVAVLELGKDIVRTTLPIVEIRSGKKVEYQDEEARKSAR